MASTTIPCPRCQASISFEPKPGDPTKEVARCGCRGRLVSVVERDALTNSLKVQPTKTNAEKSASSTKVKKEEASDG